jgi:hypothetical protein
MTVERRTNNFAIKINRTDETNRDASIMKIIYSTIKAVVKAA